jgi:hypothetical protein
MGSGEWGKDSTPTPHFSVRRLPGAKTMINAGSSIFSPFPTPYSPLPIPDCDITCASFRNRDGVRRQFSKRSGAMSEG